MPDTSHSMRITQISKIPIDWMNLNLKDLTINGTKNGLYKHKSLYGTGIEMAHMGDVFGNDVLTNGKMERVEVTQEELKKYSLKMGDILFARRSLDPEGVGKPCLIGKLTEPITFESSIIQIRPDQSKINPEYAIQYLLSHRGRHQMMKFARVVAVSGVTGRDLLQYKIPAPKSLEEQKKIAEILSSFDHQTTQIEKLIFKKEAKKRWLMQNLLTGKNRLNGFDEQWSEHRLGRLFSERNERNTKGLTLLSIGQDGVYPQSESNKKNTSNADKSKYKKICVGDIGYNTMRMWQGRSALSSLEGIVSPAYTIVVPMENADALFFSYLFKLPKVVHSFWRYSQGLVGDTLNCKFKHFVQVKVNVPKKEEQIAIAKVLKAVDKEIDLLKLKSEKLKEQKKGMMQQLLTGKKRLKIKS